MRVKKKMKKLMAQPTAFQSNGSNVIPRRALSTLGPHSEEAVSSEAHNLHGRRESTAHQPAGLDQTQAWSLSHFSFGTGEFVSARRRIGNRRCGPTLRAGGQLRGRRQQLGHAYIYIYIIYIYIYTHICIYICIYLARNHLLDSRGLKAPPQPRLLDPLPPSSRYRPPRLAQGLGFRIQGGGCRVQGAGFRVQGSRYRAPRLENTVFGVRVWV